jgi:hypothetical protein
LKRALNSYSARTASAQAVAIRTRPTSFGDRSSIGAHVEGWIPSIPVYAWVAMVALAFLALSFTVYFRAQGAQQEAAKSHAVIVSRVEEARAANKQIKHQTEKIKNDPVVKAQKAQEQMRTLRPNEIVVARP